MGLSRPVLRLSFGYPSLIVRLSHFWNGNHQTDKVAWKNKDQQIPILLSAMVKKQKLSWWRAFGAVGYGYLCKIYVWLNRLLSGIVKQREMDFCVREKANLGKSSVPASLSLAFLFI